MAPRRAGPGSEALFTLNLLGPPEVVDEGGNAIKGLPARGYGLLAYVALHKRPACREHMARLLWPRSEKKKALHSLRQLLHTLRKKVPDLLVVEGEFLLIGKSLVGSDLQALEGALEGGHLEEALEAWRGPFMEGWNPPVSWEMEEWAQRQADLYGLLLKTSLEEAGKALLISGLPNRAEVLLCRGVDLHPECEELVLLQAQALAASGRVPQAEAALIRVEMDPLDPRLLRTREELENWKVTGYHAPLLGGRVVEA